MSDLKGIDLLGLSQPITKLVESISGAIGKIYEPTHIRRIGQAKADEIKIISEAISKTVPTEYCDGKITIDNKEFAALAQRSLNRMMYQEMNKQQNIEAAIGIAYKELEYEKSVSTDPVDKDWMIKFFNSVEDISDRDLQELWGKILAGEIKQPKSFSLRTLEKLKNISKHEAEVFKKTASFVLDFSGELCIPSDNEIFYKHGCPFENLVLLDECGFVYSQVGMALSTTFYPKEACWIKNDSIAVKITNNADKEQKVTLSIYSLTEVGKALLKIIKVEPNQDYAKEYFAYIKKRNRTLEVTAHLITGQNGDDIILDEKDLLENVK